VEKLSLLEKAGRLSGASGHEQWRTVETYRSTVAQTNFAIERMVADGFRKRDPSLNY
jgi:hypothetical protein